MAKLAVGDSSVAIDLFFAACFFFFFFRVCPKFDRIVAKHVLLQHQNKVITGQDEEDKQRIYVRKSNLITDAIRNFSKPNFDVSKPLKVYFVSEKSVVDDGGPRREFFQLAMKEAFSISGLFVGWPQNVVPVHNVEALADNKFFVIGKIIATSFTAKIGSRW